MKRKLALLLLAGALAPNSAWAGMRLGLGAAAAQQSAVAVNAAEEAAAAVRLPVCGDTPYPPAERNAGARELTRRSAVLDAGALRRPHGRAQKFRPILSRISCWVFSINL